MAAAWPVLIALPRAREDGRGGYYVSCPTAAHANGDRSAGLHVSMAEDGAVLLRCFAGCELLDIVRAVGLRLRDLWPDTPDRRRAQRAVADAVDAPVDPHLAAVREAEYRAGLAGWLAACRVPVEATVESVARPQRQRQQRRPLTRRLAL